VNKLINVFDDTIKCKILEKGIQGCGCKIYNNYYIFYIFNYQKYVKDVKEYINTKYKKAIIRSYGRNVYDEIDISSSFCIDEKEKTCCTFYCTCRSKSDDQDQQYKYQTVYYNLDNEREDIICNISS
jgi:hypothetical protein